MRDERLRLLDNPGEIADAELGRLEQRRGESKPGWITEGTCQRCCTDRILSGEALLAEPLGDRQIEAEELAAIVGHPYILTIV